MSSNWQPQITVEELKSDPVEGGSDGVNESKNESHGGQRKKVVVVGLGMVGISFMCVTAIYLVIEGITDHSPEKS
jgi:nitrite reductase (NAD(P)H)